MRMYQVWVADLNSLYDEMDGISPRNPSVFVKSCNNYIEAREMVAQLCGPNAAAWIQDVNGDVIS